MIRTYCMMSRCSFRLICRYREVVEQLKLSVGVTLDTLNLKIHVHIQSIVFGLPVLKKCECFLLIIQHETEPPDRQIMNFNGMNRTVRCTCKYLVLACWVQLIFVRHKCRKIVDQSWQKCLEIGERGSILRQPQELFV